MKTAYCADCATKLPLRKRTKPGRCGPCKQKARDAWATRTCDVCGIQLHLKAKRICRSTACRRRALNLRQKLKFREKVKNLPYLEQKRRYSLALWRKKFKRKVAVVDDCLFCGLPLPSHTTVRKYHGDSHTDRRSCAYRAHRIQVKENLRRAKLRGGVLENKGDYLRTLRVVRRELSQAL